MKKKVRGFEIAKGWEDKGINIPVRKTALADTAEDGGGQRIPFVDIRISERTGDHGICDILSRDSDHRILLQNRSAFNRSDARGNGLRVRYGTRAYNP